MKELEEKRQACVYEERRLMTEIVPRSLLRDEEFKSSVTVRDVVFYSLTLLFFSVNDALCSQTCIFLIAEPSSLQIGEILIISLCVNFPVSAGFGSGEWRDNKEKVRKLRF